MRRIAPDFGSYARRIRQVHINGYVLVDATQQTDQWCIYFLPRPLNRGALRSALDSLRAFLPFFEGDNKNLININKMGVLKKNPHFVLLYS